MLALAMSYQERGQYAVALKQYEAVLGAGLKHPGNAITTWACSTSQAGQPEEAIAHFRQAAEDPEYRHVEPVRARPVLPRPEPGGRSDPGFRGRAAQVDLASINQGRS